MANIKNLLKTIENKSVHKILELVGKISKKENISAYVVGGFVRDLIMDRKLNDIDIMTIGDGIQFAKKIASEIGVKKIVPFEKFGTSLIPNKEIQIEVATARKEQYKPDSRKPTEIIYTDLKGDLIRRDFTINAMAMDLSTTKFGDLTDPFSGVTDIKNKVLRTPLDPDETFSEDPLRMMRCLLYTSPSPRDRTRSRMPSSA